MWKFERLTFCFLSSFCYSSATCFKTSSRRMPCWHAKCFCAADRRFLRVLSVDLSTRKSWRDINVDDVYTRIYSSETTRPRPTIGTQQTMNGFTLFVHFCLIPLSKTCSFEWICKDGFISIESRPFDLCTRYRLFNLSMVDVYAGASSLPTD